MFVSRGCLKGEIIAFEGFTDLPHFLCIRSETAVGMQGARSHVHNFIEIQRASKVPCLWRDKICKRLSMCEYPMCKIRLSWVFKLKCLCWADEQELGLLPVNFWYRDYFSRALNPSLSDIFGSFHIFHAFSRCLFEHIQVPDIDGALKVCHLREVPWWRAYIL